MKNILQLSILLICGGLLLQSCTKISEPYYTVKSVTVDTNKRTVLLEDYTGHLCVNCAPAAKMAHSLQDIYHGQVFAIAVHAGSFAKPIPSDPDLSADYRCVTGNEWNDYSPFNIGAEGYPIGMVNRTNYNGKISFGISQWTPAIQVALEQLKIAILTVKSAYASQTKLMNATVGVKFLSGYEGKVNLTVCILEDSIYGGQKNTSPGDSIPIIKHFRFMHMLRGAINESGSFGDEIASNPSSGAVVTKSFSADFTGKIWVPANCCVIAFITNADTKEVLHVAKSAYLKP
jgi:hypothetical protein